jgi:hypothetical protein
MSVRTGHRRFQQTGKDDSRSEILGRNLARGTAMRAVVLVDVSDCGDDVIGRSKHITPKPAGSQSGKPMS